MDNINIGMLLAMTNYGKYIDFRKNDNDTLMDAIIWLINMKKSSKVD